MEANEFGVYLKSLRKGKKLTIRQLELYSGVSNAYISQMERGERGIPSPDILKKLSKGLGVSYEELLEKAGYIDNELSKFDDLESLLKEVVIRVQHSLINDKESADHFKEHVGEEEYNDIISTPPEKLTEYLELETKIALLTELTRGEYISYEQFFDAYQIPYKLNKINKVDLSDVSTVKELKLYYDGMELTEEEKIEFISLVRAFFSARRALKEKK